MRHHGTTVDTPDCGCRRRELCNECHTSDYYEHNMGTTQGELLYNWQARGLTLTAL